MHPKLSDSCKPFYILLNILGRDTGQYKNSVPFNLTNPFLELESTIIYKKQMNKSRLCSNEIIKNMDGPADWCIG